MLENIIFIIISLIFGCGIGYGIRKYIAEGKTKTAEELAIKIVTEAEHNAEAKKRELLLEAKDEIHKLRSDNEHEYKTRRNELQTLENRILNREEAVEKKSSVFREKEDKLNSRLEDAKMKVEKAEELVLKREEELQKVAGLTAEEGKSILLNQLEREITQESALIIKENELRIKEESNKYAQNVIAQAIQRIVCRSSCRGNRFCSSVTQ